MGAVSQALEKNAELDVKLDRTTTKAVTISPSAITAPYAGSGLITIERDKVYGYAWFQSHDFEQHSAHSCAGRFRGQRIRQRHFRPRAECKGDLISPLSYGVVQFTANVEKRRLAFDLQARSPSNPANR